MNKKYFGILILLILICTMMLGVSAENQTAANATELKNAFNTLLTTGGTVTLTSNFTVSSGLTLPKNTEKITLDGDGHTVTLSANMAINGDVDIKNITFCNSGTYRSIPCGGNTVHFFDTVSCTTAGSYYPSIMAGYTASTAFTDGNLTIDGGTWQRVRCGNAGTTSVNQCATVTINGGTFMERFQVGGAGSMASGSTVDAVINGGTFNGGIIFFTPGSTGTVNANATLTINGGTIVNEIRTVEQSAGTDSLFGSCTINLNGGNFSGCTGVVGYDGDGMTVDTNMSPALAAVSFEDTGTSSIDGTLLRTGVADPWMFMDGGNFYLTMTGSTRIALLKSSTLEAFDSMTLGSNIVYDFADDTTAQSTLGFSSVSGTWSPEIHYYSEQEFPGNSGWYMSLALRNYTGDSSDVRMVVLKSQTGTSPDGPYVHPTTGVQSNSQVVLDKYGNPYDEWSCGQSTVTISSGTYKGVYALWVEEEYRATNNFRQKIMIAKLASPWQFASDPVAICYPTQYWETLDSGLIGVTYFPEVVEGATAVYGEHGEVYLTYSGSGYWSNYGLGQLTWNGTNPLSESAWVKYSNNPIFSANSATGEHYSDVALQGVGHASFFTAPDGQMFICYHAYPYNTDTNIKADARNAYLETYTINYSESNGVGNGVIRSGDGGNRPAAPDTPQTIVVSDEIVYVTSIVNDNANLHIHSYTRTDTPAPTCTEDGIYTYTCSCGDSYTETAAALGHNYDAVWTVDTPATCITVGSASRHCSRCDSQTDICELSLTEHTYEVTQAEIPATTESDGQTTIETCSVCGATRGGEIIPRLTYAFTEITEGNDYDSIATRAGEKEFAVLGLTTSGTSAISASMPLPNGFTASETLYVYCITDDGLWIPVAYTDGGDGSIVLNVTESAVYVIAKEAIVLYGDTNGDGNLSLGDVLRILRSITEVVEMDRAAADINGDGTINIQDVILTLRAVLNS